MPTNVCNDSNSGSGCQPPLSPLVAEALRLGFRIVPEQRPLPWVHLLTVNVHKADSVDFSVDVSEEKASEVVASEDDKVVMFHEYMVELRDKVVVLENRADKSIVKVIRPSDSSRYCPEGRRRIRARISKRMGGYFSCEGFLLSLTFDPKLIDRSEAWREVGLRGRSFMNKVNTWRRRNGMSKVRGIRGLEEQPGTGYPHLHYAFPRLRWLAPITKMNEWWNQSENSVDMSYRDSFSPARYVCKYVSKMEGWSDRAMAEIWFNRTRQYSMSRDYYVVAEERRVPEWWFVRTGRLAGAGYWFRRLVDDYDTVLGANDIAMEVFIGTGKG